MKILQILHSFLPYTFAGTEVYSYKLSKELAKKNEVFVFFRINNSKRKEYSLTYTRAEDLEEYAVNHTFRFCNSFEGTYSDENIDKIFKEVLEETRPDIVHIHHLLFLSHGIIREIKESNIPIIYTLHDYWLICYRGQLVKDNLTICKGNSISECGDCLKYLLSLKKYSMYLYNILRKRVSGYPLELLKKVHLSIVRPQPAKSLNETKKWKDSLEEIYAKVDLFIAPSRFIKNRFIEQGISEDKIIYSPNGFDYRNFTPLPKDKSNLIRFGYMGILLPTKGLDVLISAFKMLRNRNVELSIYGRVFAYSGFEYYPRLLKRMVNNDSRIRFKGAYDNKNVGKIFSNVDVLIVPSIWPENAPLVIQEAFASKTPVLAANIGGIPELISDGVNGLLFTPGDVNELKEKMQLIIDNPDVIEKFKQNLPVVKSIEDNAKEIEEIYRELIAKNRL